ncbi:WD40/YVTN repeat-like-containing domain protein [Cordyceps fumosorosea ARSEF 2679]|uniref:WD40/YVTN repeat-like-containing domain protein n=1 Tax=Cordyceps fumosorosea (strain ARSEF 2679) TaxID=1081104 RepID=A0A162JAL3_CORFA|nr:WD40/YVTN repeat-like-containing domain protein [Cordyceps fumosorosea ARSEF 2679]OAA66142.1 WD40/YVTN repeat-like-containing domain protein [Cordyceps fumosorosea ARSEF 2679]
MGSNGPVHAVTYSASPGTYILTGSADRTIRLYNPQPTTTASASSDAASLPQGRLIQAYEAHGYEVLGLAVASSNTAFASCGGDRAVFLWDVASAVTTRRFGGGGAHGHTSRVNCVAFAGDGDGILASGGLDTTDGACLRAYEAAGWRNEELRVQSILGGKERYVLVGDEMTGEEERSRGEGRVLAWDLLTGKLAGKVAVPWGPKGYEARRRAVGRDGKDRPRKNVVSCMAWRDDGWGDQFCVGGTSGVVTVFAA